MSGSLNWSCGGRSSNSIGYVAAMDVVGEERLKLSYSRGKGNDLEQVRQVVHLCQTTPHFGGKRWWMLCPYRHIRVGKLYLPPGGDRFASRQAWRLGYHSQRVCARDKAFERLFRLQKKLGCDEGWEGGLFRPKGMWHRTFDRHLDRYLELDTQCAAEMIAMVNRLSGRNGYSEPPNI